MCSTEQHPFFILQPNGSGKDYGCIFMFRCCSRTVQGRTTAAFSCFAATAERFREGLRLHFHVSPLQPNDPGKDYGCIFMFRRCSRTIQGRTTAAFSCFAAAAERFREGLRLHFHVSLLQPNGSGKKPGAGVIHADHTCT